MKKKFRNITVAGVEYGWNSVGTGKEKCVTIWLNKKVIYSKDWRITSITPQIIKDIILELSNPILHKVTLTDGGHEITDFKILDKPKELGYPLEPQIYSGIIKSHNPTIPIYWNKMGKCSNLSLPQYFIMKALGIKETINHR